MESSYAEILMLLVAHAFKEGLISEKDILDLGSIEGTQTGGENLYYREWLEFQSHVKEHSQLQDLGFEKNLNEKFNFFWDFIQRIRDSSLLRPKLTREQAQKFLNVDPVSHNEKEIRSEWMRRVFDLFIEHLPEYKGSEQDYKKLAQMPEVMLQLNFLDAAYQNLENMDLEQMRFHVKKPEVSFNTSKEEYVIQAVNEREDMSLSKG